MASSITHLESTEQVEQLMEKKDHLIVIDIWASWCKPCLKFGEFYKDYISKFNGDGVTFCKMDATDSGDMFVSDFMEDNKVKNLPTI
jgi:thiol-disulfide isomerase/thioredoxin